MTAKRSVHDAAAALYKSVSAPPGAVNTLPGTEGGKKVIRVLVDPMYRGSVHVPARFMGYKIVIEVKQYTVAHR